MNFYIQTLKCWEKKIILLLNTTMKVRRKIRITTKGPSVCFILSKKLRQRNKARGSNTTGNRAKEGQSGRKR